MYRAPMFALITAAVSFCAAPATAQTPDGETPAVETVCDPLRNATPGLYGLCVAFCEAHDGEFDPETLEPRSSPPANMKILENYNSRKSAGDPDMPCLKAPCPCFDEASLARLDINRCLTPGDNILLGGDDCLSGRVRFRDIASSGPGLPGAPLTCTYFEVDNAVCQMITSTVLSTTLEETTTCRDLLLAEAARRGLTCGL